MLNRLELRIYFTIAIFSLGLFLFTAPEQAYAKNRSWEFNFGLGAGYDDNVLNYSDADLDQFDSTTVDSSGQFGIESKDDFILSPHAGIVYKTKAINHALHIGLDAGYNVFTKNEVKDYGNFGLWFREYLRKEAYLQFSATYTPDYYYRNLFLNSGEYAKAQYDKIGLGAKVMSTVAKGITGSLSYRYENRNFNDLFNERDLKSNNFNAELIYQPKRSYKIWGGYEYTIARGSGRDNSLDRRDVSYDSFLFWLGSRLYLNGLSNKKINVGATASYKNTLFQTDKLTAEDRYRFGRKDNRWSVTISANHDLNKRASVGFLVNRVDNTADLPATDLKPYLDFGSTSAKIVFDYSF
jgi:hypothetical protein